MGARSFCDGIRALKKSIGLLPLDAFEVGKRNQVGSIESLRVASISV